MSGKKWSLKDKKIVYDTLLEERYGDIIYYYKSSDIDILREKLIEDVITYVGVEIGYDKPLYSHMSYVIKEIINRRFGNEMS